MKYRIIENAFGEFIVQFRSKFKIFSEWCRTGSIYTNLQDAKDEMEREKLRYKKDMLKSTIVKVYYEEESDA